MGFSELQYAGCLAESDVVLGEMRAAVYERAVMGCATLNAKSCEHFEVSHATIQ